jgi:hypothetical protein
VKSSRAYVASRLELPAVTVADRASSMLVVMATAFGVYSAWRQDMAGVAFFCCVLGSSIFVVSQASLWLRDRRGPRRWLECAPDGTLQLHQAGMEPMRVRLGASTRLLGASLLVEVRYGDTAGERSRCWLTPLDVPRDALRRWTVVLLASGRVART